MKTAARTFSTYIAALCTLLFTTTATADNGDWHIYNAYHNATQVAALHGLVYVLSDGNLYSYDPADTHVQTYDKTLALHDRSIHSILPCAATGELVVIYENGNIDLLGNDEEAYNMPDFKLKSVRDRTLNDISIDGAMLYIATNSGIVCVQLDQHIFGDHYDFGYPVSRVTVDGQMLYATTPAGIYRGNTADNLLDPNKWSVVTAADMPNTANGTQIRPSATATQGATTWRASGSEGLTGVDANGNTVVSSVIPDSPLRNYAYSLKFVGGQRLLVTGGTFNYVGITHEGTIMQYENNHWTAFDETAAKALNSESLYYTNVTDIVQDPADARHHFAGTARSGIYEFRDQQLVANHTCDNSPIRSILPDNPRAKLYVRVTGLAYDGQRNLWMLNNETDTIVRILRNDGTWTAYYVPEVKGYQTFDHTVFDRRGWAWMNSRRATNSNQAAGFLVVNPNQHGADTKYFTHRFRSALVNQDGTTETPTLFYCFCEDLDGAMWMGCDRGIFVSYNPAAVFDDDFYLTQPKIPRNDGSNLADYLLFEVPVTCIAIDGGNRKWIGTDGSGVFFVSPDGTETIHNFTQDNSPLTSNIINDIAINGTTGEVFIATDAGLVSYMGDATDPAASFDSDNVIVYPNPVRPNYQGSISITGLMYDTDVKIVNAAGYLVNHGTSVGGQYTWNGRLSNGQRCTSGIYYVLATDSEGKKGAVAKFLVITE